MKGKNELQREEGGGGVVTTSVGNCGERERRKEVGGRREEGRWKLIEGGSY